MRGTLAKVLVKGVKWGCYGVGFAAGYTTEVATEVRDSEWGELAKLSTQLGYHKGRARRSPARIEGPRVKREGSTLVVECDVAV